jgi:hypothetical protein
MDFIATALSEIYTNSIAAADKDCLCVGYQPANNRPAVARPKKTTDRINSPRSVVVNRRGLLSLYAEYR